MVFASGAFLLGAIVSLCTSWVLVTRLERVAERFGLSEALLGVVAALAADAPEITSSVSALTQHQYAIGAGVVIGSNVFNLAALLGLGAVVSGFIPLHRRVVVLGGVVAMWVASGASSTPRGSSLLTQASSPWPRFFLPTSSFSVRHGRALTGPSTS